MLQETRCSASVTLRKLKRRPPTEGTVCLARLRWPEVCAKDSRTVGMLSTISTTRVSISSCSPEGHREQPAPRR
jgi:hypothetical protein